jgi:hypothetical protein
MRTGRRFPPSTYEFQFLIGRGPSQPAILLRYLIEPEPLKCHPPLSGVKDSPRKRSDQEYTRSIESRSIELDFLATDAARQC